jgi:hypothetical protein
MTKSLKGLYHETDFKNFDGQIYRTKFHKGQQLVLKFFKGLR